MTLSTVTQTHRTERTQPSATHTHKNGVALPIAVLQCYSRDRIVDVKTIWDLGSQKSLVTKATVQLLDINPFKTIRTAINGINKRGEESCDWEDSLNRV